MAGKPIFPMAYKIKPNQKRTIYYLGFPTSWKEELIKITKTNKPNFKSEYGLQTSALQKMVDSWMEGIVSMTTLKGYSDDSRWISSTIPFDEKRINILFGIIRVWIMATYVSINKANPLGVSMAKELCATMKADEFYALCSKKDVLLSTSDGCVSNEAYQAIPLIVVNKLVGKNIEIGGTQLHLSYAAKNELVSNAITEPKSGHTYSFVFRFSVQTTPPQREALLLCDISMRRWIYARKNKEKAPFLKNAIISHIKISDDKFCQIPIQYSYETKSLDWKSQDRECYNLYGYEPLPNINDLWTAVEKGNNTYFLPYANGAKEFIQSKIGTGVPVKDKAEAYERFLAILGDVVDKPDIPERISTKQKLHYYKSPQEYETREEFRQWVVSCTETDKIRFELYGVLSNSEHQSLLSAISDKISRDFGDESENSCLSIDIIKKEIGNIANPVDKSDKVQRCDEIKDELGETDDVVACICIIPDVNADEYKDGRDPKLIIRNAFARSGRVVQFVVSDNEDSLNSQKIEHTVYDLYRQLGITTLINTEQLKSYKLRDVTCIGMHVCTQIHGIRNKARFLPLYVSHDLSTGRSRVQCAAFEENNVNYREACLEMAKLFWNENLEQLCVNASFSPAKQKLIEMKNRFDCANQCAIILIQSDGNTRQLWGGISDKSISEYNETADYIPEQIDVGTNKTPYSISLTDTGVRVFRVRNNAEVPDYYTSQREDDNYSSASGIFKYGKVFWAISQKPNDPKYNRSLKESRLNYPFVNYAEKDMIEVYPIQIQLNDDPSVWTKYITDLCLLSIQYNQSTILPLPLHLAAALEEYLLEI
ncbi:MAG: DUF3962 domain-containing protein [Oscillospiraceae bacterium]|nr:DUF3962 domain-containing protein [Oscillospiraceae bacterium]